jgi:hypothetical protein
LPKMSNFPYILKTNVRHIRSTTPKSLMAIGIGERLSFRYSDHQPGSGQMVC